MPGVIGVCGSPLLGNYLRPKPFCGQLGVELQGLAPGTCYWSVQSIDTGLASSAFAQE